MTPISAGTQSLREILVVDSDTALRNQVVGYLSEHGYRARAVGDGPAMDKILLSAPVDLVILDLRLPGEDGLSICRRLTDRGGPAVIMTSAMGEVADRVLGLERGADDFLTKPFNPRELLARVRAVIRRVDRFRGAAPRNGDLYRFLGFEVDVHRRQVRTPTGATILLTAGEFSLLKVFLDQPERILTREELLEVASWRGADTFDRAVDVQVSRLRRKLHASAAGEIIRTLRGVGYMFDAPVSRLQSQVRIRRTE